MPLAGGDPADDHGQLSRHDQADRRRGFEKRHQPDEQVGPGAERLPGLAHRPLEVRRVDHAAAVDREGTRHREPDHSGARR